MPVRTPRSSGAPSARPFGCRPANAERHGRVDQMPVRQVSLAAAAIVALALTAGCTVRVGGDQDDDGAQVFGDGNSLQWDLTRPLEAEALGLPADEMVIVDV